MKMEDSRGASNKRNMTVSARFDPCRLDRVDTMMHRAAGAWLSFSLRTVVDE